MQQKELSPEAGELRKRLLHTTVVNGVRLRIYEGGLVREKKETKCWMCCVCCTQHNKIWQPVNAHRVRLSKDVDKPVHLADGNVIHRTPTNSFSFFDPGRRPQTLGMTELSIMEKTALAEFVVAAHILKVKNANDVKAAHRMKGHALVFPTDGLQVLATRVSVFLFICTMFSR